MARTYPLNVGVQPHLNDQGTYRRWMNMVAFPEDIQTPTYTNSWTDYGSGHLSGGYYKDPFGRVWLEGALAVATSGTAAFTLPTGYRPLGTVTYPCFDDVGTAIGDITISTAGVVTITFTGAANYITMDGMSFRASSTTK